MKIGALTVPKADLPFEEALDWFAKAGCEAVEIGTGNYPGDAHCDPYELNESESKRQAFMEAIESRGLELSALSCHGNPLHPDEEIAHAHHEVYRATVQLASSLRIKCVNNFSGLPGGGPNDQVPNWVVAPWPDDHAKAVQYQWEEVAIPYWRRQAEQAAEMDVYICLEMHPNFLVYNPETLIKLREACGEHGERICANFDPSHLFWQGIDPAAAIRWLQGHGEVIKHVHAKDVCVYQWNARVNGVLDTKHYGDEINRSWIFRTVGYGHGAEVWKHLISTLRMCGYDGALSIEHEDSLMSPNEGFLKAVEFLEGVIISEMPGAMTWA